MSKQEQTGMLNGKPKLDKSSGCCHSKHTKNCCIATGVFGALFLLLGVIILLMGKGLLEKAILKSMAITPGSDRLASWLNPPVEAYMEAYAFNIKNPDEILSGSKPIVEEKGPYVYKSITVKDSDDNMQWHDSDGTLTYRPRKVYIHDPEKSCSTCDPDKDVLTFPNIPYWTGLNGARRLDKNGFVSGIKRGKIIEFVRTVGSGKPFIDLTLTELLWGYEDELPCLKGPEKPSECFSNEEEDAFGGDYDEDDDWGEEEDDSWGEDDSFGETDSFGDNSIDSDTSDKNKEPMIEKDTYKIPEDSKWEKQVKPKAEIIDCKCNWGLFRDRNITMRKPVRFHTGQADLDLKGVVTSYNNKDILNWWQEGSVCDQVRGQDASTLPPGLNETSSFEVFIALMCRALPMKYEKDVEHAGIRTLRFIPPDNALGSHNDPIAAQRNEENKCFDLSSATYNKLDFESRYFESGVLNLENCKAVKGGDGEYSYPPLALSQPHFYNADKSFRDVVHGLTPDKEKHQFYIDVVPEFGFPLAMMAQFQLNLVIFRMDDVPEIANLKGEEMVVPFLWAGLGFKEPSEIMADQIKVGLDAPSKYPLLMAVVLFALGGALLLTTLAYFLWRRRNTETVSVNHYDRPYNKIAMSNINYPTNQTMQPV